LTVKQITKSAKQLKSAITIDATFLWIALCMSNKVHEKNKQQTLFLTQISSNNYISSTKKQNPRSEAKKNTKTTFIPSISSLIKKQLI